LLSVRQKLRNINFRIIEKMCRGKNTCCELGISPEKWDKYSPLRTPEWMTNEIDLFVSAVDDLLSCNKNSCLEKINQIRNKEIIDWFIEHGQMSGRHRKLSLDITPPSNIDTVLRDPVRSPMKVQNAVFERDGYKCRYCGNKLISQDFFRLFIKKLNSNLFKRGKTNLTTHGIIHIAWPVADHVIPWNRGGQTSLDNLVSSCAPCNYGKDGYTIEQIGIENPFYRKPQIDGWIGLTERFKKLKTIDTQ
jgi:5-methylcytosine-specific restriction endonuclease McrA